MRDVEIRYAERAGGQLAFSLFGDGPHDLVFTQVRTPIDLMFELPQLASFMDALGRMARVIVFDSQGSGASDTTQDTRSAALEESADDLLAVLDAAGSERPTILDATGGRQTVFAAAYPERVRSMIIVNLRSSYPELHHLSAAQRKRLVMRMRSSEWLRIENPRVAHDPVLREWWERAARLFAPPQRHVEHLDWAVRTDVSGVLPTVRTPTLVLHRRDNKVWDIESSRAAAALIPGAQFVELPGAESDIFLGDTTLALAEIERFLNEPVAEPREHRQLATVLFTDIVGSTEELARRGDDAWRRVLETHEETAGRLVTQHRGRVIRQLGDGTLATFDGPARAVHCAVALLDAAREHGIALRAGLHTGEIEIRPSDIAGIAVHIASRVSALAAADEILVSRTVVDLTVGSGLRFEPHGDHRLKGVPGTWALFAAHVQA